MEIKILGGHGLTRKRYEDLVERIVSALADFDEAHFTIIPSLPKGEADEER